MVMVVECESCHSRFRVKKSLLVGAYAIRFRCRSCGGFIVVRNPDMQKTSAVPSPAPPPPPSPPEARDAPATQPGPEEPAVAGNPARPDPYVEPDKAASASTPDPAGGAGPGGVRLEDLVLSVYKGDERSDRDAAGGSGTGKPAAPEIRSLDDRKRAWAIGVFRFFAVLGLLLLLASGAYYIGAFNPWAESPTIMFTLPWSSKAVSAKAKPVFDIRNLEAYIPREAVAGNMFVISGTVRNVGNASSRGIRIHATLFGNDNQVLMRQETIAGSRIDKYALSRLMREEIEGRLSAGRTETGTGKHDVPPGNSLPFIVVCFDPPGVVESYQVLATNAER